MSIFFICSSISQLEQKDHFLLSQKGKCALITDIFLTLLAFTTGILAILANHGINLGAINGISSIGDIGASLIISEGFLILFIDSVMVFHINKRLKSLFKQQDQLSTKVIDLETKYHNTEASLKACQDEKDQLSSHLLKMQETEQINLQNAHAEIQKSKNEITRLQNLLIASDKERALQKKQAKQVEAESNLKIFKQIFNKTIKLELNKEFFDLRQLDLTPLKKQSSQFFDFLSPNFKQKIGVSIESLLTLSQKIKECAAVIEKLPPGKKLSLKMQELQQDCTLIKKYLTDIQNQKFVDIRTLFINLFAEFEDEFYVGEDAPEIEIHS